MISLGSCTMRLNAAALMQPLSLAGFQNMHPFAPADQTEGYRQPHRGAGKGPGDDHRLRGLLAATQLGRRGRILGADGNPRLPPEPRSGLPQRGADPASAHGTNPASAAMAG